MDFTADCRVHLSAFGDSAICAVAVIGSDHVPQRAMTDFNDPEQRLDYLLLHGVDAYNKAMEDHFARSRPSTATPSAWSTQCGSARSIWSTASTAATRPWTAPARSREVKHDRARLTRFPFAGPAEFTRAFSAATRPRHPPAHKPPSEFRKPVASLIPIFPAATATATRTPMPNCQHRFVATFCYY